MHTSIGSFKALADQLTRISVVAALEIGKLEAVQTQERRKALPDTYTSSARQLNGTDTMLRNSTKMTQPGVGPETVLLPIPVLRFTHDCIDARMCFKHGAFGSYSARVRQHGVSASLARVRVDRVAAVSVVAIYIYIYISLVLQSK